MDAASSRTLHGARLGGFGGQLSLLGPAWGPLPQLEPVTVGVQRRDADTVGIVHGLRFHELHAAGPEFLEVLAQVVGAEEDRTGHDARLRGIDRTLGRVARP